MTSVKIILMSVLLFSAGFSFAQNDKDRKQMRDSMNAIMKQKIISNLELDDATADKFISVYKENNKNIRMIMKEKKELMESIENDPNASDIDTKLDKILQLETDVLDLRKSFFRELKTFLSPQQIAKTLVLRKRFERQFRKEVMKQRDGKKRKERVGENN
ncbi:MAG: hypothetical protein M3P82_05850 [Bacteroidota bacterium]|nr:hypothetical protein [Bacteroidota bacterium]